MRSRLAPLVIALAALAFAGPAPAADTPQTSNLGSCATATSPRDATSNPEARRGAMDEQFCTQLDRLPGGRSFELYGGTVDGGQRRASDPALSRPRDELEHQDGFFGLRLRVPLGF